MIGFEPRDCLSLEATETGGEIEIVEDVAVRPDLADRALQIELDQIPKENRIPEKDLWEKFHRFKAEIFSAILDGLACSLRNYETTKSKLKSLPRMADAVTWVTAGETAFGFKPGAFMAAYQRNLDENAITSVESSLVGLAIINLFKQSGDDQWHPDVRLVDPQRVSEVPLVLAKRLAVVADEDHERLLLQPSGPQALHEFADRVVRIM